MKSLRKSFFFLLALTTALAAPVVPPDALLPRHETRFLPRQQATTQPVSFQTVETTQTPVGTITQTCTVTLTPVTDSSGAQSVREDKNCTYVVLPSGQSPPPPAASSGTVGPAGQSDTQTSTTGQATTSASGSSSTDAGTTTAPGSSSTSASSSAPVTDTTAASPSTTSLTSTPVADSNSSQTTDAAATPSAEPNPPASSSSSAATATTVTSTLSNGAVTTLTLPLAAEAQTSSTQEVVPGRNLQVLPIGLGVFAGISVIALIVVGLVTYERTKYRKAFRQRKMAEAGANMGYGGMAERT